MYRPDVVHGLLHDGGEVASTVEDLESHGVYADEIEVSVPAPGRYELADSCLHDDVRAGLTGALAGAGVGIVVVLLVTAALSLARDIGALGWVVLGLNGAGFGALVGGVYGLQRCERLDDDDAEYTELDDVSAWRVVTVHCLPARHRAQAILQRHGASILDNDLPLSRR